MSDAYSREMMKVAVAKMLQTIGWNSIHSTPLEILTDILVQYTTQLAKSTHDYANEFGCADPNLDHLGLAFKDFHVNLSELEEYVTYVNFGQPPTPVPKFPIPREDNLNFLKPGSKEVVTRQVHIHEHLPPMYQINEVSENNAELPVSTEEHEEVVNVESTTPVFKRPAEVSPGEPFKRPRLLMEEEGRPTREISSVMMTTSGYISPAREGKLPESRTPLATLEPAPLANNNTIPAPSINGVKPIKPVKKLEKKKERVGKELFKPLPDDKANKKVTTMKDVVKMKQLKAVHGNGGLPVSNNNFVVCNEVKLPPVPPVIHKGNSTTKINKALAAARLKTEKLNTTITPIPIKQPPAPPPQAPPTPEVKMVDKLFTEPDKKKVNILKKISNVKNEKLESKISKLKEEIKQESRESSPDLIIDESNEINPKVHISNDITIELIDAAPQKLERIEKSYFDDDSPPGTPSTPKTPEMISQSPPVTKEKRKRKDKSKIKKVHKIVSPARMDFESSGYIDVERPKTPEAVIPHIPPHPIIPTTPTIPFSMFTRPGLIPNPLFPNMALPFFGLGPNCMPPVPTFLPPIRPHEEPRAKSPIVQPQKPPTPILQPIVHPIQTAPTNVVPEDVEVCSPKLEKKSKEHKKEKKDKIKKKNKKDKVKNKAEKKKLKEERKDKDKIKKEKKEKRKDKELQVRENLEITIPKLTLKLGTPSPRPDTPDTKKLNIKPVIKKEEEEEKPIKEVIKEVEIKREMSPELAKISALVTGQPKPKAPPPPPPPVIQKEDAKDETAVVATANKAHPGPGRPRIHPIKQKSIKPNKRQVPVKDSEGNEVWICPSCGRQDDGSPMIGCDDCDAWYHWVCVGIQVPPDDNEDWYCRLCIVKKQEVLQSDKKKKRKKREKKEH